MCKPTGGIDILDERLSTRNSLVDVIGVNNTQKCQPYKLSGHHALDYFQVLTKKIETEKRKLCPELELLDQSVQLAP